MNIGKSKITFNVHLELIALMEDELIFSNVPKYFIQKIAIHKLLYAYKINAISGNFPIPTKM